MPTIFLFTDRDIFGEVLGRALAEDGVVIGSRAFPSVEIARKVLDRPTRPYRDKYPNGYDLAWVDDITQPGPWAAALERQQQIWEAGRPAREAEWARQQDDRYGPSL